MPLSISDLEYRVHELCDLQTVPDMSIEERSAKLADYQARADRLSFELKQALDALQLTEGGTPNYWALKRLSSIRRKHNMARKSLERLEDAIRKAEETEQAQAIKTNIMSSHEPVRAIKKKKGVSSER